MTQQNRSHVARLIAGALLLAALTLPVLQTGASADGGNPPTPTPTPENSTNGEPGWGGGG